MVIVSWNARNFLRDCLRSLADRVSEYPWKIIVVDNASTDGSAECVEREFPHVQLIRNPSNLGFARANNIAIRQSNGRYVCLINSDVKVLKDCITHLVDYCEQHHDVGMVGPYVFGADGRLQRSCPGIPHFVEHVLSRIGPRYSLSQKEGVHGLFAVALVAGYSAPCGHS